MDNIDIFRLHLNSDEADEANLAQGNCKYNIKLANKKTQYSKILLYVDNFNIFLILLIFDLKFSPATLLFKEKNVFVFKVFSL